MMDNGLWVMDNGLWIMDDGQWILDADELKGYVLFSFVSVLNAFLLLEIIYVFYFISLISFS